MENETTVVNQNLQANASKPFHNTVLTTNKHGARASRKREKSEIKTICTQEIKEPVTWRLPRNFSGVRRNLR